MKAKKIIKITFLALLALIAAVLVNTCIYVFAGQYKSVEKLSKGQELSLYECCSIYVTHLTMCFVGYPIAPEAARECLKLHFTDRDTVYFNWHNFSGSKKLEEAHRQLIDKPDGSSVRISWNGNKDYSPFSGEHRLAIAANPCTLTKIRYLEFECFPDEYWYTITTSTEYPKYSRTEFNFKKFKIVFNEGLFRYLQDKGWLHKYTAVYHLSADQ